MRNVVCPKQVPKRDPLLRAMSAPAAETGWQKLSQTQATCTRLVAASILYKSSRLGPFTPARIRIASTTTSRTEMHSCKFAWLPPYNEMQNVPKRRQGSCTHYCGYVIVQVDSPELHAEPILNTASVQRRARRHYTNTCNPVPGAHLRVFLHVA